MNREQMMGYEEALKITLETISPLKNDHVVDLAESFGRVLSQDLYSRVDSPSIDASMKDGYAVKSNEIEEATPRNSINLKIIGVSAAGGTNNTVVENKTAIRILTGAKVPEGANAVIAEEFTTRNEKTLTVFNNAAPGRNILPKGSDVTNGELIAAKGSSLSPGMISILVAAGHSKLPVYNQPKVAILATGDELVVPGQPLEEGKLYASNLEMLKAWCLKSGMQTTYSILSDKKQTITDKIAEVIETHDAVITSGGAWTGDRDYVADTLNALGWKKIFHSIRIGPGKPVGFGMLNQKPVFILPGGPPSNLTAFLQIALPGLLKLGGHNNPCLPRVMVKLKSELVGRHINWTEFVYGKLETENGHTLFKPLKLKSRLKSMAGAEGVVAIPEGIKSFQAGAIVNAQIFV